MTNDDAEEIMERLRAIDNDPLMPDEDILALFKMLLAEIEERIKRLEEEL